MKKKEFKDMELELICFENTDVIATSGDSSGDSSGGYEDGEEDW